MIICLKRERMFLFGAIFLAAIAVFAISADYTHAELMDCDTVPTEQARERCKELKSKLPVLQEQLLDSKADLEVQKQKSTDISQNIESLEAEIRQHEIAIQARRIAIDSLSGNIAESEEKLAELRDRMNQSAESLEELIRRTDMKDNVSIIEIILSSGSFSDFFTDVDELQLVRDDLQKKLAIIEEARILTKSKREELVANRIDAQKMKEIQMLEKKRISDTEAEKEVLLAHSQTKERFHEHVIAQREEEIAQIRSALFELRGTSNISFGEAYDYAKIAHDVTGIRPAFLLAIITQETNLGKNLGSGTWRTDMHPTRDTPLFKVITDTLGLNPDKMQVSAAPGYGWGGAMGPAQFIPSTWAYYGGYVNVKTGDASIGGSGMSSDVFFAGPWKYDASKDRVRGVLGSGRPSNPWNPLDAFVASALLLTDNGAAGGNLASEELAALRYFAGWAGADNPAYAFYGNDVMQIAADYQRRIDVLKKDK